MMNGTGPRCPDPLPSLPTTSNPGAHTVNLKAVLVSSLVLVTASAWGQMAPKPGPELKKLDYFVGTWTAEGTIAPGPWGAGGKFSSTDTMEWMPGNFFVEG